MEKQLKYDYSDIRWQENSKLKLIIVVGTRPEIIRLAEWDTTVSKKFAKQAIYHLQTFPNHNLPKDGIMIFEI